MRYLKMSKNIKKFLMVWFAIGIVCLALGLICNASNTEETIKHKGNCQTHSIVVPEFTMETKPKEEYTSLGIYRLTAYCACEKCCEYWATVRPLDENGKPIVYTANQSIAKQGVTVAADTSVLPFGTVILIDGHEYTVQDRGGVVVGNRVDIYFESHEEALAFGVQYKEIFVKE